MRADHCLCADHHSIIGRIVLYEQWNEGFTINHNEKGKNKVDKQGHKIKTMKRRNDVWLTRGMICRHRQRWVCHTMWSPVSHTRGNCRSPPAQSPKQWLYISIDTVPEAHKSEKKLIEGTHRFRVCVRLKMVPPTTKTESSLCKEQTCNYSSKKRNAQMNLNLKTKSRKTPD